MVAVDGNKRNAPCEMATEEDMGHERPLSPIWVPPTLLCEEIGWKAQTDVHRTGSLAFPFTGPLDLGSTDGLPLVMMHRARSVIGP